MVGVTAVFQPLPPSFILSKTTVSLAELEWALNMGLIGAQTVVDIAMSTLAAGDQAGAVLALASVSHAELFAVKNLLTGHSEARQRRATDLTRVIQDVRPGIRRQVRTLTGGTTLMENAEPVDDRGQSRSSDEMDHSKIDNFSKTHPGESFPKFRSLSSGECAVVRTRLLALLDLGLDASGQDIVKALHSRDGRHLGEVSLEQPVDLRELLRGLPLVAHHQVFLNWYHFDEMDVMDVDDLSKNFDDIWYPSVDDVEIFDESETWFLGVSHDGRLTLLEL